MPPAEANRLLQMVEPVLELAKANEIDAEEVVDLHLERGGADMRELRQEPHDTSAAIPGNARSTSGGPTSSSGCGRGRGSVRSAACSPHRPTPRGRPRRLRSPRGRTPAVGAETSAVRSRLPRRGDRPVKMADRRRPGRRRAMRPRTRARGSRPDRRRPTRRRQEHRPRGYRALGVPERFSERKRLTRGACRVHPGDERAAASPAASL